MLHSVMKKIKSLYFVFPIILLFSCSSDTEDPPLIDDSPTDTSLLVDALDTELNALTTNPLSWGDNELTFLDPLADKSIIGLGEATHGTADFFNAKFRIFKYLVENHNFKILAIEADFGESLLINDAIQRGATDEIEDLMRTKMIFWTWRTEEVKNLLEWMSEYNKDKSDDDKLQYLGFDCQFNRYHPDMVKEYLQSVNASFISEAEQILNEAETATQASFDTYSQEQFEEYLAGVDSLSDLFSANAAELIAASSENDYELNLRLVRVIRQVSEVNYARVTNDFTTNYRDLYMAENTAWMYDNYNNSKIAVWAHNAHISNDPTYLGGGGAMGRFLTQQFGNNYSTIAFLFSRGSFNAVTSENVETGNLIKHTLNTQPKINSINYLMSLSNSAVFSIEVDRLQEYEIWQRTFSNSLEYFDIGALYNNDPENYYRVYNPIYYDFIIYFNNTSASVFL